MSARARSLLRLMPFILFNEKSTCSSVTALDSQEYSLIDICTMHGAVCPPFNICVFITFEERTGAIVRNDCASGKCNTSDSAVLITNDGDTEDDDDERLHCNELEHV